MKYIEGNLLNFAEQGKFDMIIHGCNCLCTMGSGIAKQIKDRYPKVFLVDQMTEKGDHKKLGKFTQSYVDTTWFTKPEGKHTHTLSMGPTGFTVVNAYTQLGFFPRGKVHVDYDAIDSAFRQIKMLYDMNTQASCRIGIPQIGAGLAGGDWARIERIIDDIGFSDLTCVIYKE